jgi:hypothetical protein
MSTAGAISTPVLRQAVAAVAQALLSLLFALSLVMLTRRISGAFVQPLSGPGIIAVAAGLVFVAGLVRILIVRVLDKGGTSLAVFVLPSLAAILLLASLTLSGTPAVAIAIAWFVVIASEGASWLVAYRPELLKRERRRQHVAASRITTDEIDVEPEAELPAGLVQQLTRVRENDRESIHALLLAEIPPGDRLAVIHIAFCPPLEAAPELTAHALDTDDADVRITQAETFGARIEVRVREVASEQRSVLVEVLGSATCR